MSKHLRNYILALVAIVSMTMQTRQAVASHAMGADLTYECLGGNTYLMRVSFYRDCIGIAAPANVFVNVRSVSCSQNLGITCYPVPGTGQEVTPLCPTALSSCNGGIYTGIQEWVYEGVITLPMQCTDWVFSYNLCCRNAAINTITTPSASTFYILATLNNVVSQCNSSPTFSNKPVPFACLGQQYCFNHGAFDADGDSLVYSLITPYQNATTPVSYISPFTPTNPLTSSPPISFNTATGDICMTPQNLEITVMAVLVKEYRNGVLIGSVERDIQITVLSCNNTLPTLTGINGTNNFSATVCAGDPLCFFINSADPDASQNVFMNWDASIPGATFTTTSGPRPTGNFCWTPTQNDISNNPYCFTVRVNDDACPMIGSQIYSYCITVIGVNVNAGADQLIACNDLATLNVTASGGTGNYTYLWSNGVTLPIQTVGVGTYIVTVSDGVCSNQDTVNVINAFEPTALFNASGSCPGMPVHFTDQSTLPGGVIISWNWNFGGTGISTVQNPTHTFPGPGSYNVSLIVETSLGCIDTIIQPVVIYPPPTASFTAGQGCVGAAVSINNTTTPSGNLNWQWNFGNGQTSTGQNPTIIYSNPGTYTITLIAGDTLGCADTVTQQITINPLPTASFTYSAVACLGGPITFTNTSNPNGGTIVGWQWNFGNGQTSTGQNPVITFPTIGNYDVTLVVTNSNGCTATILQTIAVNPPPVANAGANQAICLGASATLVASGGGTYVWSPGGQTSDIITVSPTSNTTYTVTVTDNNGCTASSTVNVTVNPLPIVNVSPGQSICVGQSVTLSATGAGSYTWSPSGHTTGTITVSPGSSTTYAVTGTNANGCSATNFVTVTVNPLPVVNLSNIFICAGTNSYLDAGNPGSTFLWSNGQTTQNILVSSPGAYSVIVTNAAGCTASDVSLVSQSGTIVNNLQNVEFCNGGSAILDAGNPGYGFVWSTGATTQTIVVSSGGAYSVTITDALGCSGTVSTTVNVNSEPVAQFTPSEICINEPMNFTDISSIAAGSIVGWSWSFGDGNISQQQNPAHYYPAAGSYNVTLVVTSDQGCTDSIVRQFNVYPLPLPNFSYLNGCVGSPINFSNSSTTAVGTIGTSQWSFGDGSTSTVQNPSHTYNTAGIYPVKLIVTTGGGCVDSIVRQITISPLPIADFTPTQACRGLPVNFTSMSSVPGGVLSSWNWDFGNSQTSTLQNPTIFFGSAITYNVSLIVTSSFGCTDTIIKPVTVYPKPVVDAGPAQSVCFGDSAFFTATGGVSFLWSTGATTQTISLLPLFTTIYSVTITDANGCVANDSVIMKVRALPIASGGPDKKICAGQSVSLTGTGAANIVWNPGNINSASISVSPIVTTDYIITVTALNGCVDTDTVTVVVNQLPLANAGPDQLLCEGTTATLTATGGTNYQWITTGANSQSIYVNPLLPQVYVVQVTDSNGCKAIDSVSVGISPTPTAVLNPVFICLGNSTTLNAGNPGSTYLWSPTGETTQSISVSDSGFYDVIITSANGCVGYASADVYVGGSGLIPNPTNVQICQGNSTVLSAGNPTSTYVWSTGATSQTITVTNAGSYTVTITDNSGCSASFASNVIENPLPILAFASTPTCEGASTLFTNNSSLSQGIINTWLWSFGDGNTSNVLNPLNGYPGAGMYNVTLSATTGMGCSTSVVQPVIVEPMPMAFFSNNTVCFGSATDFVDGSVITNGGLGSWNWSFGDGATSTQQSPSHTYTAPGLYMVSMIVSSVNGCLDSITQQISVYDSPIPQFASTSVCEGNEVSFINTSSINDGSIISYNWNFGDGNNSTAIEPIHLYAGAGTYNVTLTVNSDLGCSASVSMPITIYSNPIASFTTTNVCEGLNTNFNSTSTVAGSTISGVYWNFGDGGSSNNTNPDHLYASTGLYQAVLITTSDQGCIDTAHAPVVVNPLPEVAFSTVNACLNNSVSLNDLSTIASGSVTGWSWSLGDGNMNSGQNPSHVYSNYGSYNVTFIATSDLGCVDSTSGIVNVFPLPVAAFAKSNVCEGTVSEFFNQSQIPGGGVLTCSWDFGDGNVSADQNPQHVYAAPGTYTVTMIVASAAGCTDTISQIITIYEPPTAAFMFLNACDGTPISFTDVSTSFDGIISTWNWSFGDGSASISVDPYHVFPSAGSYPVTLEVTTIHGCKGIVTDSISVFDLPVPVISSVANCVYDPVTFNSVTAVGDTTSYQYLWNFGDGFTSSVQSPAHQYSNAGSYNVSLTMVNGNGCNATASINIDLSPAPDANFNFADACAQAGVQFNNLTTISSGSISNYIWNFGDGSAITGLFEPFHIFDSAGVYTVVLIAISDNGCVDTISQQITIFPLPVSNFNYSQAQGCGPLVVNFTDSSFIATGTIISWNWDFGNGETSQLQNPAAVYTASGTYGVSLTVTSNMGCINTFTQPNIITVYPGPEAAFTPDPYEASILHPIIEFNNQSSGANIYAWTFGDGGSATMFEPSHTYPDTGTYLVTLWVQNSYGCIDTVTHIVRIVPEFVMYVPNAFTPNSDGINDFFTISGIGIEEITINIFNRWGENLYTTTNLAKGWDGSLQKDNSTAQQDVYVYDIRVVDVFGKRHQQYGRVTLVR